jgi:hypothetical protein
LPAGASLPLRKCIAAVRRFAIGCNIIIVSVIFPGYKIRGAVGFLCAQKFELMRSNSSAQDDEESVILVSRAHSSCRYVVTGPNGRGTTIVANPCEYPENRHFRDPNNISFENAELDRQLVVEVPL